MKAPKHEEIERLVAEWFHQNRTQAPDIPLDGCIIKEKAKQVAQTLGMDDFTASNGWIDRFRKRHEIKWRKVSGESLAVDVQSVKNWRQVTLRKILFEYNEDDIFNADELGLFFNLLPDKTMAHRTDTCHG